MQKEQQHISTEDLYISLTKTDQEIINTLQDLQTVYEQVYGNEKEYGSWKDGLANVNIAVPSDGQIRLFIPIRGDIASPYHPSSTEADQSEQIWGKLFVQTPANPDNLELRSRLIWAAGMLGGDSHFSMIHLNGLFSKNSPHYDAHNLAYSLIAAQGGTKALRFLLDSTTDFLDQSYSIDRYRQELYAHQPEPIQTKAHHYLKRLVRQTSITPKNYAQVTQNAEYIYQHVQRLYDYQNEYCHNYFFQTDTGYKPILEGMIDCFGYLEDKLLKYQAGQYVDALEAMHGDRAQKYWSNLPLEFRELRDPNPKSTWVDIHDETETTSVSAKLSRRQIVILDELLRRQGLNAYNVRAFKIEEIYWNYQHEEAITAVDLNGREQTVRKGERFSRGEVLEDMSAFPYVRKQFNK